ncbi:MAG: hypothetical protein KDA61_17815, partial [Planctomycetales bacterium]|nr:hypothetical protein [Planctomycetales bacterium]
DDGSDEGSLAAAATDDTADDVSDDETIASDGATDAAAPNTDAEADDLTFADVDSSERPADDAQDAAASADDSSVPSTPRIASASATARVSLAALFNEVATLELKPPAGSESEATTVGKLSAPGFAAWQSLDAEQLPQRLDENATSLARYLDDAWKLQTADLWNEPDADAMYALRRFLDQTLAERWRLLESLARPLRRLEQESSIALSAESLNEHYPLLRAKLEHFYQAPLEKLYLTSDGRVLLETDFREGAASALPRDLPPHLVQVIAGTSTMHSTAKPVANDESPSRRD